MVHAIAPYLDQKTQIAIYYLFFNPHLKYGIVLEAWEQNRFENMF